MKKFFMIFVLCFLFAGTACSSPRERFYDDKSSVEAVGRAKELNSILRTALEESDEFKYEIESTYVTAGYFGGRAACTFHVLTTDGKYLDIRVHGAERLIRILHVYYSPYEDEQEDEEIGKYFYHEKELWCN